MAERWSGLPGAELVRAGLADLARGADTVAAALVAVGAPRLRRAGVEVPQSPWPSPERRLYALLRVEHPTDAYGRYNAIVRLLVSFERALERG